MKKIVNDIKNRKLNDARDSIRQELQNRSYDAIQNMKPEVMKNAFGEETEELEIDEGIASKMKRAANKALWWDKKNSSPKQIMSKIKQMSDEDLLLIRRHADENPAEASERDFQIKTINREIKKRGLKVESKSEVMKNAFGEETEELDEATRNLTKVDKKTIDAFYNKKEDDKSFLVNSTGKVLKKVGFAGAQDIAKWEGGKVKIVGTLDDKSSQAIVNYIKKTFPKNLVTEEAESLDEKKIGKRYQFVVPETDVPKMKKYLKDAEMEYDIGTEGNKAVFDIDVMDQEELDIIKNDLKNERVRFSIMKEEIQEAKMSNAEVLDAAKTLAKNAKDEKTKKFAQGLVDYYNENDSFTPDQVSGLQNIMKNAGFQMAKESVELDEMKAKTTADKHMEKIARDVLKNPSKAAIMGPYGPDEAAKKLKKIGYTDKEISKLRG